MAQVRKSVATGMIALIAIAISSESYSVLFALPVVGYGFAWVGHFVFEKNKPATFHTAWRATS